MAKIDGGATIWARKTINSDVFLNKPDKWFKIWFYLVNKVKFIDEGKFKRGEGFIKYEWISEATGATKHQIEAFIKWAKEVSKLTTQKTTRGMIVNVFKYEFYQDIKNYKNHTEMETETTQKPHTSHTILNNDKNDKNEKNVISSDLAVAGVNKVMEIFSRINPTLNWGNKTTRGAAAEMIKKFGLEVTLRMAEQVVGVQGQPYVPTATTPYQMKDKLAQFIIYFKTQKNKAPAVFEGKIL